MTDLRATIRLQFHKDFTLDDAVPLVSYFARLGISHVYASPLLTARPGSMHGYDVLDPTRINPELGGEPALERLVSELRKHDMGLILDIVSNHMAVGGSGNPWWLDVLEWGPMSPYAHFFDIQWQSLDPFMHDQLLVPFLRTDYGEVLSSGELKLHFDADQGQFFAAHYDHRFPLYPPSYPGVLRASGNEALNTMAEKFQLLDQSAGAWSTARALRKELAEVVRRESLQGAIEQALSHYEPTEASGRKALHALLERQYYRLASWRTAADDINWRRFFDINELGGLRVELPDVFEATHAKVFELVENGSIDGLRIDHVDGLANPRAYCRRLRRRVDSLRGAQGSAHFPIYVEKIIGEGEALPAGWGVDGTTGYEFMNQVSLLQHDVQGREQLETLWNSLSGRPADFLEEVYEARKLVLAGSLAGDLESVAHGLLQIARFHIDTRDLTLGQIRRVLTELVAHFPVYRTYAGSVGRSADDQRFFDIAKEGARRMLPEAEWPVLDQLDHWLGGEPLCRLPPGHERNLRNKVLVRFQQLTSPAAAKAVEDTACYRAGVLLSRYDVGFDPQHLAADAATFHDECQHRAQTFPDSMLTTATHDNKRGEDTRARLAVLSERAAWLADKVQTWQGLAVPLRGELDGAPAPTPGDEAILYQSLLGSWSPSLDVEDAEGIQAYLERLLGWQEKALREAKLISSWSSPNEAYEHACREFLTRLMTADDAADLRREIAEAVQSIAPAGALNGLVQTMLRLTVPGVPDLYQGCEFWDFNLVDPDNRRPVDFAARVAALQQTPQIDELVRTWPDGRIKQWLIHRILAIRAAQPQLFRHGAYVPLEVEGEHADRVVAFARRYEGDYLVTVVPRTVSTLLGDSQVPLVPAERWGDTRVCLPSPMQDNSLTCALSLTSINPVDGCIAVGKILAEFPVNLLCSTPHCKESSV